MMSEERTSSLPEGWEKSTMGEIGRYLNGFAFSSKTWSRVGRPIIRIQNLTGSGSDYNYFDGDIDDRYVVREGDLLFSWAATLGVHIWRGPEAVLNQHIFKVESNIDKSFHRSLIEHKTAEMMQQTHGTGMVHITKKKFDAIPILKPSAKEQQKIVEILDEQLSRLDAALASVRAAREKAARFRRSLLHAAFSGVLTGHDSSLGTLPNDWKLLKIAEFASVKGGKRLPKGTQWSEVETNHPYIRATDIKNGKINEENLVYVPEKIWPAISRYIVATNDVIITIAGTIGFVAVVPETLNEANLTENAAKICQLQNVLPRFLLLYLMSPETQTVISGLSTSTTQAKLALFRIESIEVPTPSLSEQQKIVEIVDTQISILDQSLSLVDAIDRKASALRRSLLHAAFTGELTKEWREGAHV
jgi:type I restriction enzyme S subunit